MNKNVRYQAIREKYNLPDTLYVEVRRMEKGGFYAVLPDYPGCVTLGKDFLDLIRNVNDALITYFKIPREDAEKLDVLYFPQIKKHGEKVAKDNESEYFPQMFVPSPHFMYA